MLFPRLYPSQNDSCSNIHADWSIFDLVIDKKTIDLVMCHAVLKNTNKENFTYHPQSIFNLSLCCFLKFSFYKAQLEIHKNFKQENVHHLKPLPFQINFNPKFRLENYLLAFFSL
jgi:hypothetical protein